MSENPLVIGICGSKRGEKSITRTSFDYVSNGVETAGGRFELVDLAEYDLPPLNPERQEIKDAVKLKEKLKNADGIVLGTPVYHASISGVLKNALDYCGFDEFEGKTVGLVAVAGGGFPVTALNHLRIISRSLNSWVIPHQVAIPNANTTVEDGDIVDEGVIERCETLGEKMVEFHTIHPSTTFEGVQNKGA